MRISARKDGMKVGMLATAARLVTDAAASTGPWALEDFC